MSITDAITAVYVRATGKTTVPDSKVAQIVALLDFYQRRWAREPEVDWNSLYDPAASLGTVTNTDTFDIDTSSIRKLSDRQGDYVRILWTDGVNYTKYDIVNHDTLKNYSDGATKQSPHGNYCAQIGSVLVFNHTFISTDAAFGGTITVPAYAFPDEITNTDPNNDVVQVDDPDWLVTRCAAEVVRNDIVRRSRYPELLEEANEMMKRMIDDNGGQIDITNTPWTPFTGHRYDNGAWS